MKGISSADGGVLLNLRIVPRASRDELAGELGDALKVRLRAPPVDGKANKELVRFLADILDVARSRIALVSGETGRTKRVFVKDLSETAARDALAPQPAPDGRGFPHGSD